MEKKPEYEQKAEHHKTSPYSLQEYLSLGYIYLIILGIISDVIYFNFFDINILKYAAISDILISPVSILVKDMLVLIFVIITVVAGYFLMFKVVPSFHAKHRQKKWYAKFQNVDKLDKYYSDMESDNSKKVGILLVFLVSLFLGMGLGSGRALQQRIENGTVKATHSVTFEDMAPQSVRIIGQNSGYVFYLKEGEKVVTITPMGQVKEIRKINANGL